ncbi:uncharacterized protein Z520_02380 [Fonsecaea multimorphosa CBS 102226]|uniref:Uncharacterized protein n=1 Tax=Fonsecaea multimorphosa CBS 102226 TaxID=1442371 RepID=A0A0D2IYX0_9EURO|nr:uncharacterized protein Z520_02380 [Fonsecaea multimorphosa CBS 102226]KIY02242.1 hypothetical protein Z520_02380 [Fonsecaea multimorphosa CBS 102226]OAL29432.1 hypothetical protein AYO22_02326 [Fonsecaea multimorphosa]
MADHATNDKAEPAQAAAGGIKQNEASTESAKLQTGGATHQFATPKEDEGSSNKRAGSAKKQNRTPATFSVATEDSVREMMNNARRVLQENGNSAQSGDDLKDMALLATNLVQLMNASFIATDTIVRAIAYMRGDSQLTARSAISQARRDRRAQKNAEQPLEDVKNSPLSTAAPGGEKAGNKSAASNVNTTFDITKVSANVAPKQENTALVNGDQQQKAHSLQPKANKKKSRRNWRDRRSMRKQKDGVDPEVQANQANVTNSEVNGVSESKESVDKKATAGEHKPETSGEETAAEGEGAVVAVKA